MTQKQIHLELTEPKNDITLADRKPVAVIEEKKEIRMSPPTLSIPSEQKTPLAAFKEVTENDLLTEKVTENKERASVLLSKEDMSTVREIKKRLWAKYNYTPEREKGDKVKSVKEYLTELEKFGVSHRIEDDRLVIDNTETRKT